MDVPQETTRYDAATPRQSYRYGAERGIRVFIPAAELRKAGFDPHDAPPDYRVWGQKGGGVHLRLYRT